MFLIMNDFDRVICDSHYTKFMYWSRLPKSYVIFVRVCLARMRTLLHSNHVLLSLAVIDYSKSEIYDIGTEILVLQ